MRKRLATFILTSTPLAWLRSEREQRLERRNAKVDATPYDHPEEERREDALVSDNVDHDGPAEISSQQHRSKHHRARNEVKRQTCELDKSNRNHGTFRNSGLGKSCHHLFGCPGDFHGRGRNHGKGDESAKNSADPQLHDTIRFTVPLFDLPQPSTKIEQQRYLSGVHDPVQAATGGEHH